MNSEYICFEGTAEELHKWLEDYFDADQVDLVVRSLPTLVEALNESESVKAVKPKKDELELLISDDNYFINVRKTTLALLGLILDIAFTRGAASLALQLTGNGADKIRKLSYDEKQILLLINADKILIDPGTGEYSINDEKNYHYTSGRIKEIIDKMADNDIVKVNGRDIRICF